MVELNDPACLDRQERIWKNNFHASPNIKLLPHKTAKAAVTLWIHMPKTYIILPIVKKKEKKRGGSGVKRGRKVGGGVYEINWRKKVLY